MFTRARLLLVVLFVIAICLALVPSLTTLLAKKNGYIPRTRTYYIAAEDVNWNFAPGGKDRMTGKPIPVPWVDQVVQKKTRYIEYTDATFTKKKPQAKWLGILGPIIRGVPGDTIKVVFYNKASKPYSMHPHGVRYDKTNEGAAMDLSSSMTGNSAIEGKGARVNPGQKFTYTWKVSDASGPQPGEGSSKIWMYHSHVSAHDINQGLVGPIIITSRDHARPDGTPDDVDKEFVALFMIFTQPSLVSTMENSDTTKMYAINGYIFSNLQGLSMHLGDRVRWHVIGLGNDEDVHTPHWHGELVKDQGQYTDVVELLPASMKTVDMLADNPGVWMFHCHVQNHMAAGMMTTYTIE